MSLVAGLSVAGLVMAWTNPAAYPPSSSSGGALYYYNGNIGIGTTAPGAKLDVAGSIRDIGEFSSTGTGAGYSFDDRTNGSGERWVLYATGGTARLWKSGDKVSFDTTGNVGIGTTGPGAKLHVYGADDNTYGQLKVESSGNDARISLYNANGAAATGRGDILMSRSAGYEGMRFMINNADKMILDENGNVGIGTTGPSSLLSVSGGSSYGQIQAMGTSASSEAAIGLFNVGDAGSGKWVIGKNVGGDTGGKLGFYGNGATRLTIDTSGNVGIGTASPSQKLEVAGTVYSTSGGFKFPDGTTQTTAASSGLGGSGTTNYLSKFTAGTTIGNSIIYDNGTNVGIGTAGPTQKLDVSGHGIFGTSLYAYLYLRDDESTTGPKSIHANSNVIGFLNGAGSWISYWGSSGDQTNMGSIYAGSFIDRDNTGYYLDPASTSITNDFRANIFYDNNNTVYYIDPASTSNLNQVQADRVYGFSDIRSPIFYDYNNTGYYVDPASTSITNDFRANIFYDNNNTNYYLDPYGASSLYTATFGGDVTLFSNLKLRSSASALVTCNSSNAGSVYFDTNVPITSVAGPAQALCACQYLILQGNTTNVPTWSFSAIVKNTSSEGVTAKSCD